MELLIKMYYSAYFRALVFTSIYFVLLFCESPAKMKLCIHYYHCLEIPFFTLFEILQNWLQYLHTTFDTGWSKSMIAVLVMKEKPWFSILLYLLIRIPSTVVRLILSVAICVHSLGISNVDFYCFFQHVTTLSVLRHPFVDLGKGVLGFKEARVSETHTHTYTQTYIYIYVSLFSWPATFCVHYCLLESLQVITSVCRASMCKGKMSTEMQFCGHKCARFCSLLLPSFPAFFHHAQCPTVPLDILCQR